VIHSLTDLVMLELHYDHLDEVCHHHHGRRHHHHGCHHHGRHHHGRRHSDILLLDISNNN
jgi:hypothetical protein